MPHRAHTRVPSLPAYGLAIITVGIFGALVAMVTLNLRAQVRAQIIDRDARILYPVALLHLSQAQEKGKWPWRRRITDEQLLVAALNTSALTGVIGMQVYGDHGQIIEGVPNSLRPLTLPPADMERLRNREPISRYYRRARLEQFMVRNRANNGTLVLPILEVIIPLHRQETSPVVGAARYLIDATPLAAEFTALDQNLFIQAGTAFVGGSVILWVIIVWSFRQLQRSNRMLQDQSRRLAAANYELGIAAKTSAIGAIAAHLVHGLKNPLTGLHHLAADKDTGDIDPAQADWNAVLASTERMRAMVDQVTSILREQEDDIDYDFTLNEIRDLIEKKARPLAEQAKVALTIGEPWPGDARGSETEAPLDNRHGNLLLLILINLIENAIDAAAPGGAVAIGATLVDNQLEIRVHDNGPGLSPVVKNTLFYPCQSSKSGGSGIGLTISKQLAKYIDAELILETTGPDGTAFIVKVPLKRDE